MIREDLLTWLQ